MIVLDTTILVYVVGAEHPLRQPCQTILGEVRDGSVRATTTVEVIQEFAHTRARRRPRQDATTVARDYANALRPLMRPQLEDLLEGLSLFEVSPRLAAFDAVLAAVARRREMPLASADRSFGEIEGLTYLDPASESFIEEARAAG